MSPSFVALSILVALACASQADVASRIVGGTTIPPGGPDITWQVYLRVGSSVCGGSIIAPNLIMTAGHCVRSIDDSANTQSTSPVSSMTVVPGRRRDGSDTYSVNASYIHPTYVLSSSTNRRVDMAILELTRSITLTSSVTTIPLADASCSECEQVGTVQIVSGYGNTVSLPGQTPSTQPLDLHYVEQTLVTKTECDRALCSVCSIPDSSFCAGDPNNSGKDSCTGDSGGPLALNLRGTWTLTGVVQAGTVLPNQASDANKALCGHPDEYGIYTSVKNERTWIDAVMRGEIAPSDNNSGGGTGSSSLLCFHAESLVSYKGGAEMTMAELAARREPECLVPHTFVSNGVRIETTCHSSPLRLTHEHMVFSASQGLVQAQKLRVGDQVYGAVDESRVCEVLSVTEDVNQEYMGLNCFESEVLANGVKCSTFETQHLIPSLWMRYVSRALGLERASRIGEAITNLARYLHVA